MTTAILRRRLDPQTGTAFRLGCGQMLKVIDPCGEQVADLFAFREGDTAEWLSSGRTLDYAGTIRLSTGHDLYSNASNTMLKIVADTVGCHDFLLTPCSQRMFDLLYEGWKGYHPSCLENLANHLASFGVRESQISTTFNIFMDVSVRQDGQLVIGPPPSAPGDHVVLRAEMDLWVGLTACSAEKSNNDCLKPIDFEIMVEGT